MATAFILWHWLTICSLLIRQSVSTSGGALPGLFLHHDASCEHDHGLGPSFGAPDNGSMATAHHGAQAQLACVVHQLHHRAVSWLRRTADDLQLMTVGESRHTADPRIEAEFIYPHTWMFKFNPAFVNDSGTYVCQVSTDPPLVRYFNFQVSVPEPILELIDSRTGSSLEPNQVLYYRIGSSLELQCRVQRYWIKPVHFHWLRSGRPVSDDLWRGGISIYTEATQPGELRTKLSIANASGHEGGNYTCQLSGHSVSVNVHFLKEENQAASQHASNCGIAAPTLALRDDLAVHLAILAVCIISAMSVPRKML